MIVRARSPYIIFINEVGQTSGKLELRIWKKGETKPTLPTYSFTKSIPSPTQTLLRFNISPYLKDFISNKLNDVNTWYCKFECRLFSNNVELTAQKVEGIAVNGYTTFLQGQNATGTAQDLKNSIDNLQIGGRNLALNSKGFLDQNNDWVRNFNLSENLIIGQQYTVRIKFKAIQSANDYFGINDVNGGNSFPVIKLSPLEFGVTFTADANSSELVLRRLPQGSGSWYQFESFKIERENKATDWTPAPEDEQYRFSYIKRQINYRK